MVHIILEDNGKQKQKIEMEIILVQSTLNTM